MTSAILPSRHHFALVGHQATKHIFEEAIHCKAEIECIGPILDPLVAGIGGVLALKTMDCAAHFFWALLAPCAGEGRRALYYFSCAVLLDPLHAGAQVAAAIVRLAASILGSVSSSVALNGWWFAEVIEITSLKAFTGLFGALNLQPLDDADLKKNFRIDPHNAVEFFGEKDAKVWMDMDKDLNVLREKFTSSMDALILQLIKTNQPFVTALFNPTSDRTHQKIFDKIVDKSVKPQKIQVLGKLSTDEAALLYWHIHKRLDRDEKTRNAVNQELEAAFCTMQAATAFGTASYYL